MRYTVGFKPRVGKDLKRLDRVTAGRIVEKIERMADDLAGDIKHLTNHTPEYRLRVGDYRVLFEVEGRRIVVYRVLHRREAYD